MLTNSSPQAIIKNILTFFSTPELSDDDVTALQEIREYQTRDTQHDINRKKTAQYDTLMTNVFEKTRNLHGEIVCIISDNWSKGDNENIYKSVDNILTTLDESLVENTGSYIMNISLSDIPNFTNFFKEKTIVVSDFLWSKDQLNSFLQACHQGKVRGLIIPLLTSTGKYHHPLLKHYPSYFWQL